MQNRGKQVNFLKERGGQVSEVLYTPELWSLIFCASDDTTQCLTGASGGGREQEQARPTKKKGRG